MEKRNVVWEFQELSDQRDVCQACEDKNGCNCIEQKYTLMDGNYPSSKCSSKRMDQYPVVKED
jgi:hypothetical protein